MSAVQPAFEFNPQPSPATHPYLDSSAAPRSHHWWRREFIWEALCFLAKRGDVAFLYCDFFELTHIRRNTLSPMLNQLISERWLERLSRNTRKPTRYRLLASAPPRIRFNQCRRTLIEEISRRSQALSSVLIFLLWKLAQLADEHRYVPSAKLDTLKSKFGPTLYRYLRRLHQHRHIRIEWDWTKNQANIAGIRLAPSSGRFPTDSVWPDRRDCDRTSSKLLEIIEKSADAQGWTTIGLTTVGAKLTGLTPHAISLALRKMEKAGLLETRRRREHPEMGAINQLMNSYRSLRKYPQVIAAARPEPRVNGPAKRNANYNWSEEHASKIRHASRTMKPEQMARYLQDEQVPLPVPPPKSFLEAEDIPSGCEWLKVLHTRETRPWFDNLRSYYKTH
jgi:hypothetical protein